MHLLNLFAYLINSSNTLTNTFFSVVPNIGIFRWYAHSYQIIHGYKHRNIHIVTLYQIKFAGKCTICEINPNRYFTHSNYHPDYFSWQKEKEQGWMKPAYLDFFKLLHASLLVFINDQVVYRTDRSSTDRSE